MGDMALWQIAAEYREQFDKLSNLDLPPEVVLDTIESIKAPLEDKVRAVLMYVRGIEALAVARTEEAKRLDESAATLERRAESLRSYVQANLQATGVKLPLRFVEFDVNLAKLPPSCEIGDASALPEQYLDKSATVEITDGVDVWVREDDGQVTIVAPRSAVRFDERPKKKLVLEALKRGEVVPGARLNPTGYRLTVK